MKECEKRKDTFEIRNVRKFNRNSLPSILRKAQSLHVVQGLCIFQDFEPIPMCSAMSELGFDSLPEKVTEAEYRVHSHKSADTDPDLPGDHVLPFKSKSILNFNTIDAELADVVVNFWKHSWGNENPGIDMKTCLQLFLVNDAGAISMRQAVREFAKPYSIGARSEMFDDVIEMLVWNRGIEYFASDIVPSDLFAAFKHVKNTGENIPPE